MNRPPRAAAVHTPTRRNTPVTEPPPAAPRPDRPFARSPEALTPATSRLLVIDLQDRLVPHIAGHAAVTTRAAALIRGAVASGVPVSVSEQYPRGLGRTVPEVTDALAEDVPPAAEKLRFSAAEVFARGNGDDRFRSVLCGIETHICVAQTALDLLAAGDRVTVVADAVGSRRDLDHRVALDRLRDAGATVTTTEAVLFEWCETAEHPAFAAVREVVQGLAS